METLRGKMLLLFFVKKIMKSRKQNQQNKEVDQSSPVNAMKMNKDMIEIVKSFTITRISNMIGMLGVTLAKEDLLKLNKKLNKIRIPKKKNYDNIPEDCREKSNKINRIEMFFTGELLLNEKVCIGVKNDNNLIQIAGTHQNGGHSAFLVKLHYEE